MACVNAITFLTQQRGEQMIEFKLETWKCQVRKCEREGEICSFLSPPSVQQPLCAKPGGLQGCEGWLSGCLEAMKRQAGKHWLQTDPDMSHRKKRTVLKSAVIGKEKKTQRETMQSGSNRKLSCAVVYEFNTKKALTREKEMCCYELDVFSSHHGTGVRNNLCYSCEIDNSAQTMNKARYFQWIESHHQVCPWSVTLCFSWECSRTS